MWLKNHGLADPPSPGSRHSKFEQFAGEFGTRVRATPVCGVRCFVHVVLSCCQPSEAVAIVGLRTRRGLLNGGLGPPERGVRRARVATGFVRVRTGRAV